MQPKLYIGKYAHNPIIVNEGITGDYFEILFVIKNHVFKLVAVLVILSKRLKNGHKFIHHLINHLKGRFLYDTFSTTLSCIRNQTKKEL